MRKDKQIRPDIQDPATTFSISASWAINKMRAEDSGFQNSLNKLINSVKSSNEYNNISFKELAKITADTTRKRIIETKGNVFDLDLVGWEMGLLCYTWRNSINNIIYKDIFIASWEIYFTE